MFNDVEFFLEDIEKMPDVKFNLNVRIYSIQKTRGSGGKLTMNRESIGRRQITKRTQN